MAGIEDYRLLTGPQKAAVFMLAIGQEQSSKLFENMDDEEIRELSQHMAGLGTITSDVVEQLFAEFTDQLSSAGGLVGTYDSTERLLRAGLPEERVALIMEEIRGPAGRTMWDKLGNVNETVLANYLKNEYPQTAAVVLSKIKSDHAARVLAVLPDNFAMDVIIRMLRMEAVQKDVLDHVEKTLRSEFMTNLNQTARRDSHELMAEIFNSLNRDAETRFMTELEERAPESAAQIQKLVFTFDDLSKVDPGGVQVLLREVDKDQLTLALKGANDEVKTLFFSNMSERAGKMLKEDMAAMGAVRMKEVEEAQTAVVQSARTLADSGDIVIATGGEDDELVY